MGIFAALAIVWVGVAILYVIVKAILHSINLKARFARAGVLRGRTKADIIAAVGRPTSTSAQPGGKSLIQWMETLPTGAYHICVLFDANGVCEGVTHEHDTIR